MSSVEEYIKKQWPILKHRVADLESRKRLLEAEASELTKELEKARQEFDAIDSAAKTLGTTLALQFDFVVPELSRFNRIYKYGDVSIKQAARLALDAYDAGLNSHELHGAISRRYFEGRLERTSFSPQLSRLKADGEVEDREQRWVLTDKGRGIMSKGPILPYWDEPNTNEPPGA